MELMVGLLLSSVLLIGFTLLSSGIWGQLSYEDVHEKVQRYGNYVLDDISKAFNESNVVDIRIDSYADGYSVIRVEFDDGTPDIKYSIGYMASDPLHENIQQQQVERNTQAIHRNNDAVNQYYNEFENKGYAVSISKFKCNQVGTPGGPSTAKYGNTPGGKLRQATYIVDMQIEIHRKTGDSMDLYNTIDFQRVLFVKEEFITSIELRNYIEPQKFIKNGFI